MSRAKRPLIIDCDPGIDDFVAILLAHSSQQFDIRAITTLGGNVRPEYTAANARDTAALIGLDCAVGVGAQTPLMGDLITAEYVHGPTGLGGVQLPRARRELDRRPAWDILYDEACRCRGKLEIAALGPLTNVAIMLRKHPEAAFMIDKLNIMGGSTTAGNHSAYGEFNIWEDPLAADIVFTSGIDLRMVGLNCTAQGICAADVWQSGIHRPGAVLSKLRQMMDYSAEQTRSWRPDTDILHYVPELPDAVAVAGMIDDTLLRCRRYPVLIEVSGTPSVGRTLVDWDGVSGRPRNCEVALQVDAVRITELYRQMFAFYEER